MIRNLMKTPPIELRSTYRSSGGRPLKYLIKLQPSSFCLHTFTAFTLTELLVVIAILSLLAAMLFPSLKNARYLAEQMKCMSSIRQLGLALQEMANENDGYISPSTGGDGHGDWYTPIVAFMGEPKQSEFIRPPLATWKTSRGCPTMIPGSWGSWC